MKRDKRSRELAALGHEPFTPTDDQRKMVQIYKWNGLTEGRIAELMGLSQDELVYYFGKELEYGDDQLLAFAASRIFYLASQNIDLGVALRASQHITQAKSRRWRIPKQEDAADAGKDGQKRVTKMSLDEVEEELADLERRRREAVHPSAEEGPDTPRKRGPK